MRFAVCNYGPRFMSRTIEEENKRKVVIQGRYKKLKIGLVRLLERWEVLQRTFKVEDCMECSAMAIDVDLKELSEAIYDDVQAVRSKGVEIECVVVGRDVLSRVSMQYRGYGMHGSEEVDPRWLGWDFNMPTNVSVYGCNDSLLISRFRGIKVKCIPWFSGILIVPSR